MIFLAVRYSFIFWLSFSDSLVLPVMEADDQEIYRISACTARCLWRQQQEHSQHTLQETKEQHLQHLELQVEQQQQFAPQNSTLLEDCYYFCRAQNSTSPHIRDVRKISENFNLKLVCRDDRNLTFRIDMEGGTILTSSSNETYVTNRENSDLEKSIRQTNSTNVYVIKTHLDKKAQETLIYVSDDNFFTISDLKHNTTYNITAVVVHANNEYSVIAKGQQYRTLKLGFTPGLVQDIQLKDFHVDEENEKRLNVEISWKPSVEMTCHYNIICFSPTSEKYDLPPFEIRNCTFVLLTAGSIGSSANGGYDGGHGGAAGGSHNDLNSQSHGRKYGGSASSDGHGNGIGGGSGGHGGGLDSNGISESSSSSGGRNNGGGGVSGGHGYQGGQGRHGWSHGASGSRRDQGHDVGTGGIGGSSGRGGHYGASEFGHSSGLDGASGGWPGAHGGNSGFAGPGAHGGHGDAGGYGGPHTGGHAGGHGGVHRGGYKEHGY